MKHGDSVLVCYDGKMGRAVPGLVLRGVKGSKILVRFNTWVDNEPVEHWFRKRRRGHFGGYVPVKESLMAAIFGAPGDWYSVYPLKKMK